MTALSPITPLTDADREWLAAHAADDPAKLMLKHHGDPHLTWLAMQLECRRKARGKIAPELINRLVYPNTLAVEQCTSSEIAREHATLLRGSRRVLDMTCGLGMDTFALAARGAEVTTCDIKADNAEAARINAATLGLPSVTVIHDDSLDVLARMDDGALDTIIVDPARRGEGGRRLYSLADCTPAVSTILPFAETIAERLFVKASPMLDIRATLRFLAPYRPDIHIFGTRTECKELCLDFHFLDGEDANEETWVTCHTIGAPGIGFSLDAERSQECDYALPREGDILLEPFPAIVKGGCFRLLSEAHSVPLLSPKSHLYILPAEREAAAAEFPATAWRIEAILPWGKAAIREVKSRWPRISVATRGFMLDAEALRKKLQVTEAPGNQKLWGATNRDGNPILIIGSRL